MWRRLTVVMAAVATLGMGAAACGSSSKTGASAKAGSQAAVPSADKDKAKAQAALLTQADVGSGYEPADASAMADNTDTTDKLFDKCAKGNPVLLNKDTSRQASNEFDQKDNSTNSVATQVEYETSAAAASGVVKLMGSADTQQCLGDAIRAALQSVGGGPGVSIAPAKVEALPVKAAAADQTAGVRLAVTAAAGGNTMSIFLDMVFVSKGRGLAMVNVSHENTPPPQADLDRFAGIVASRL